MSFSVDDREENERPQAEAPQQGPRDNPVLTGLSWLVILAAATAMALLPTLTKGRNQKPQELNRGELIMQELMGRYILGAREVIRMTGQKGDEVVALLSSFPASTPAEQLCQAILEGEIKGPQAALDRLASLEPAQEQETRVQGILLKLFTAYQEENFDISLPDEERLFLRETLGWFAELALHPARRAATQEQMAAGAGGAAALRVPPPADSGARDEVLRLSVQTTFALLSGLLTIGFLAFIGFILLLVLLARANKGQVQAGMGDPVSYGGIYAETFALWILVFPGLSVLFSLLLPALDLLETAGMAMLASLVVLFWPRFRGVGWLQMREDIGWTSGTRPGMEPIFGLVCYVLATPLMIIGIIFFALVGGSLGGVGTLAASDAPSHPIIEFIIRDDPWTRFKLVFLACVIAPVVEETMFRGFLYRHLRDLTRGFGSGWSFAASGFLASFIFAVIHPQGLLFVPVLMGIAMGLTIGREWRGTLLPSMLAHALNNGIVLAVAIRALEG